jgi:hypothetical protein
MAGTELVNGESNPPTSDEDNEMANTIPDQQVAGWRSDLEKIEAEMALLAERKVRIQRKLSAFQELFGESSADDDGGARAMNGASQAEGVDGMSLIDAIPSVLRKFNRPMMPNEIKSRLYDVGYDHNFAPSYFYTAIKRAVERKLIIRTHDKNYIHNPASQTGATH